MTFMSSGSRQIPLLRRACSPRLSESSSPPRHHPRVGAGPAWPQSRMCDHAPVCHAGATDAAAPEVNCRTCLHADTRRGSVALRSS
jgi:hypothetical protein